jgi:hypothetical protein
MTNNNKGNQIEICRKHGGQHQYIPMNCYNYECPVCYIAKWNGDDDWE